MNNAHHILQHLSGSDALAILEILARADTKLAARIAEIATAHLREIDMEEVAAALYDELDALEVEEVWDRAGNTRHGYVEPVEAADQMIVAILEPYLQEITKLQQLGMLYQAGQLCKGLLKGFCTFEKESASEFKDWAGDAPIIFAEEVIIAWKSGNPSREDIAGMKRFMGDTLDGWGVNLV